MMKFIKYISLVACFLFQGLAGYAIDYSSVAPTGNWNTASTWNPTGIPGPGDNVIINYGHTITGSGNISIASLEVRQSLNLSGSLSLSGTITMAGGSALQVGGALVIPGNFNTNGTVTIGGNCTVGGYLTTSAAASLNFSVGGNLLVGGNITNNGHIQVTGNCTSQNGSITNANGCSLNINGSLYAKTGLTNGSHQLTIGQSCTVDGGGVSNANVGTLDINGALTVAGGFSNEGNVIIDGAFNLTSGDLTIGYSDLIVVNGNFTKSGNLSISGTLIVTGNFNSNGGSTSITPNNGNFYAFQVINESGVQAGCTSLCFPNENCTTCDIKGLTSWQSSGSPASQYVILTPAGWVNHLANVGERSASPLSVCTSGTKTFSVTAVDDGNLANNTFEWAVYGGTITGADNTTTVSGHTASMKTITGGVVGGKSSITVTWEATAFANAYVAVRQTSAAGCSDGQWSIYDINIQSSSSITAQSTAGQTQCIGGTFTPITVTASGSNLTYQWYSNTNESNIGGTSLGTANGAQTSSYTPQATSAGTLYYYCVVSGDCGTATSAVSGAFVVNPTNTVGHASSTPTLCINTALTPITHTTTGATGIGTPTGLPAGVTAGWSGGTITISGTPTTSGTFNYSIPLTGGCGTANATGTIIVKEIIITDNAPNTICQWDLVLVTANEPTGGTGPYTYTWNDIAGGPYFAGGVSTKTGDFVNISTFGVATGTYPNCFSLTVTDASGCSTTKQYSVTVNPNVSDTWVAKTNTVCAGQTGVVYTVESLANTTYNWTVNEGTIASGTGTNSITVNWGTGASGTVSVSTNTNSICTKTLNETVTINPVLEITLGANPSVCPGTTSALLPYSAKSNTANRYSIDFDDAANTAGLTDITDATISGASGNISISLPGGLAVGTYNGTLTLKNFPLSPVCTNSYPVTIILAPLNSASAPSTTPTLCINTALTPITHTTQGATGIGAATGLPAGVTAGWSGGTITISGAPTASGTFNYIIPLTGGCGSVDATGTITVETASVGGSISGSVTVCAGTNSTILTLSGHTGAVTKWQLSTSSDFTTGVTDIVTTSTSYTATNISATTYYRAVVQSGVCAPTNSSTATITVVAQPVAPGITKNPTDATVCAGQTLTVSVSAGSGGTGTIADEYRYSTNNGTSWSNWSTTVPSFAAVAGTNIIESRRTSTGTGCSTSTINSVSWSVDPTSVAGTASASSVPVCKNTGTTLTLTGSTGAIQWEQSANGTDGWTNVSGGTAGTTASYTTPNLTVATWYRAKVTSGTCTAVYSNVIKVSIDSELPVIYNCPANITVPVENGLCSAVVTWTAPTASDNCSISSFTSNYSPGATIAVGTTTVTYTATDTNGNIITCSFTVTVTDNIAPTITCPANVTVSGFAAIPAKLTRNDFTSGQLYDNCSIDDASFQVIDVYSGSCYTGQPLTILRTYQISDNATPANTSSCTQTITVNDVSILITSTDLSGCTKNNATITSNANGFSSPIYQWETRIDGSSSWTIVSGQTGSSLNVSSPVVGHQYRLKVSTGTANQECYSNVLTVEADVFNPVFPISPAKYTNGMVVCGQSGPTTISDLISNTDAVDNCTEIDDLRTTYSITLPDNTIVSGTNANVSVLNNYAFPLGTSTIVMDIVDLAGNRSGSITFQVKIGAVITSDNISTDATGATPSQGSTHNYSVNAESGYTFTWRIDKETSPGSGEFTTDVTSSLSLTGQGTSTLGIVWGAAATPANYRITVTKSNNTTNCQISKTLDVTVLNVFNAFVKDYGNTCHNVTGQTTIDWIVELTSNSLIGGSYSWSFSWRIKLNDTQIATGTETGISSASKTISRTVDVGDGSEKNFRFEIFDVTDSLTNPETLTTDNADDVKIFTKPTIGF